MKKRLCILLLAVLVGALAVCAENHRMNNLYAINIEDEVVCPKFKTLIIDNQRRIAGDDVYFCFMGDAFNRNGEKKIMIDVTHAVNGKIKTEIIYAESVLFDY